ncbi:MAG TPA: hypothetical protein VGV64_00985 [Thermoplasmata archaeon]|nr:hypothetical protein [Thermoplasmata archaeon]
MGFDRAARPPDHRTPRNLRRGRLSAGPRGIAFSAGALLVGLLFFLPGSLVHGPPNAGGPRTEGGEGNRNLPAPPPAAVAGGGEVSVYTDDARAFNTSELSSNLTLPTLRGMVSGTADIWLYEPLTTARVVGVGIAVSAGPMGPSAYAEWGTWGGPGGSNTTVNRSLPVPIGTPVRLDIALAHGTDWRFTLNGASVPETSTGLVDLGVSRGDTPGGIPAAGLPAAAPQITVRSSDPIEIGPINWSEVLSFGARSARVAAGDGLLASSGNAWGVIGEDQQPSLPSDRISEGAGLAPLPTGTNLWGIGNVNFPPIAAWTSENPVTFSTPGSALELSVPAARTAAGGPIGLCQELLEPLVGGPWITEGACWFDGVGVRSYLALTQANGPAYQVETTAALPSAGSNALLALRDLGGGTWRASVNGVNLTDPSGNASFFAGSDRSNASLGPYGALRGYPNAALPDRLDFPEAILIYPDGRASAAVLPPEGRIAPSDAVPPADVEGREQNLSLPPGAIEVRPGQPSQPFETPLWGVPTLAPLEVGAPATVAAAPVSGVAPFAVRVTDTHGDPVAGAEVSLSAPSGAGTVSTSSSVTDPSGRVFVTWSPIRPQGNWTLTVRAVQVNYSSASATVDLVVRPTVTPFGPIGWIGPPLIVLAAVVVATALILRWRNRRPIGSAPRSDPGGSDPTGRRRPDEPNGNRAKVHTLG